MNAKTNEPGRASRWLPVKPGVILSTEFAGLTTGDLFLQERLQENTTGAPSQTRAVTGLQRYRRDRTCVARDKTCVKAGQNMRNFPLQSGTEHAWITFAANRVFHSTASHRSTNAADQGSGPLLCRATWGAHGLRSSPFSVGVAFSCGQAAFTFLSASRNRFLKSRRP
ncbi:hypothetical protein LY04_03565 [Oceanimonas baumannii]|uniref:Uncharacterized protein n=1 Tax=Oceanimonas baumannii TaxID=129578 RepID=A0ABY2EU44_9GAMM|nr:hypothetical protein LY04_03565 [Oceanimonas baumannii]